MDTSKHKVNCIHVCTITYNDVYVDFIRDVSGLDTSGHFGKKKKHFRSEGAL